MSKNTMVGSSKIRSKVPNFNNAALEKVNNINVRNISQIAETILSLIVEIEILITDQESDTSTGRRQWRQSSFPGSTTKIRNTTLMVTFFRVSNELARIV